MTAPDLAAGRDVLAWTYNAVLEERERGMRGAAPELEIQRQGGKPKSSRTQFSTFSASRRFASMSLTHWPQ